MRVILAGLFVFIGTAIAASVLLRVSPITPPAIIGLLAAIVALILCAAALVFFNFGRRPKAQSYDLEELKKNGLVEARQFEAARAFEVEEFEDEGRQYFVELKDGSVLFLAGQYLYDYAFPCRKFTILWHKEKQFVLDLVCEGEEFKPEFEAPHFKQKDFDTHQVPEDGQIISNRTYEQIKAQYLSRR